MISLDVGGLSQWFAVLPDDFQKAIFDDVPDPEDPTVSAFVEKLANTELSGLRELFENNTDALHALGKIGRARLLSALASEIYPYQVKAFHDIVAPAEDEGGEEGGSAKSETEILFLEDIKAMNDAIAARVYNASTMDQVALQALNEASFDEEALPTPGA